MSNYQEYQVREYTDRTEWRQNNQLHRLNGPAIEYSDGDKKWYQNGKLHREDGPSIEWANGDKLWYQKGKPHREDGPAIEYANGYKSWYLEGKELTEAEYLKQTEKVCIPFCDGEVVIVKGQRYRLTAIHNSK